MTTGNYILNGGLDAGYNNVSYSRVIADKWGTYSTFISDGEIEQILDLVFSVCGPAGCGETMAHSDECIIGWQNIGPEICDLFKIKGKYDDEEEEDEV